MSFSAKDASGNPQVLATGSGDGGATPFKFPAATGIGAVGDTAATDSVSSWSMIALLKGLYAELAGTLVTKLSTGTSGGSTPFHLESANTTNPTVVKASAGQVYGVQLVNRNTTTCASVKFYDVASAPTAGTTAVKKSICIPAASSASQPTVVTLTAANGISFVAGISITITAGTGLASDVAVVGVGDVTCDIDLK